MIKLPFFKKRKHITEKQFDTPLESYYNSHDEDGRLNSRHGQVEFLTTVRYIEKYLQPDMKLLEIGAATGRYSHYFARKGIKVDAVELIEHNIDIFKKNTLPGEKVSIRQGNALDLSDIADGTYDITLLLGPMYHLYTREDQKQALSEAIRVTKSGGIVFAAYVMADATIFQDGFQRGHIWEYIEKDMIDINTFETFSKPSDLFELYRREDIDRLMQGFPVTHLHFVAADGIACYHKDLLKNIDQKTYDLFLSYHFFTCERQDMTGISNHTIDIFRKEENP